MVSAQNLYTSISIGASLVISIYAFLHNWQIYLFFFPSTQNKGKTNYILLVELFIDQKNGGSS